ncbi:transglycosylase domain-containing protein [Alkaliphilus peptidifermentans]|uniref:Penicillin-binding protein 1A n=1 Tax=Alkaliphilus peptidifermentans DSM 18978 TaxID=1120976 RepID=A0A1G5DVG3_9FIRM|nr:PBP1A family penicillin-binding protein [Alkaliphilus peptidifermentans]SCY18480.1 penicillin-binding protein 1A [Alkaliphilus peptidifermentans DSM 18978]
MSEKKSSDQNNKKGKKNKNRKISIIRVLILTIILIGFIGGGAVAGIVLGIIRDTDPVDATNIYDLLDESSFILDSEGRVIEKIQGEGHRIIIDYDQMPQTLIDAFIAIEDERFWTHNGVDVKRIFGATWTNLRTGSRQGASTINQQLAKIIFLSYEQTYTRKIQDAYYGILINRQLTKEQILEAYLNTINLGSGAYGVEAAAQIYFSKSVDELTVAQSALLAGITRHPSRYSPFMTLPKDSITDDHIVLDSSDSIYSIVYRDSYENRMKTVLSKMNELGYINDEEYEEALNEDIKSSLKPNRFFAEEISSYFGDLVKRDVINALQSIGKTRDEASNLLHSGGLRIYSTMDVRIQKILEEEYEKPENFPGTLKDSEGNLIRDAEGNIQPQSAMVITDHHTGEIKALVGGRMITGQKIFNRALSPRQPGSSMKPIAAYTAAIDQGFTAATVIDDIPVYFNKNTPNQPWPNNWYRDKYFGLITFRESVEQSSNVGAVIVANMLGADERSAISTMLEYMEKMGLSTVIRSSDPVVIGNKRYSDETFSTALGGMTRGVTPLDMTTAYGIYANQGLHIEPITFTKIYDRHGNLLYENNPNVTRVLTPQVSYIMTDMLRTAVTSGTGSRARLDRGNSHIQVAGKTGTTTENKDAWFVGFTPYYTASVWVGNDLPRALSDGSRIATELWKKVMERVHEDYSPKNFERPDNIISVNICKISGKRASDLCAHDPRGSTVRSEIFIKGTEPRADEVCDIHVLADVHIPTGKLATEHTPPWEVESKIFVQRAIPYFPEEHGGIIPRDYIYELPREYYDPTTDWLDINPWPGSENDEEIDNEDEDAVIDSNDGMGGIDNDEDDIVNNLLRNIGRTIRNNQD